MLSAKARLTTNIRFTRTHPERVPGDSYFSVRFLVEEVPIRQSRSDFLLVYVLNLVVPYLSGWLGVILGIIITSNFIPDLLREGEIELLLTKQTPRWLIFLGRFIGASLFFGLLTGVFLGLGSIVLYLSTGVFTGYMIASFFPLMLIFFMVYSLSALIGLLTQSRILSILGALFGWFTLWLINYVAFMYNSLNEAEAQFFGIPEDHWFVNGLLALDTLLPSGSEINSLSLKFLNDLGFFSDYTIEVLGLGDRLSMVSPFNILLSSIGFIVFFLGLSIVVFYRKEF